MKRRRAGYRDGGRAAGTRTKTPAETLRYRATLTPDDDTVLVEFPDLPGTHSFGDSNADALAHGKDALETMLESLLRDHRPIPKPTTGPGEWVTVPARLAARLARAAQMVTITVVLDSEVVDWYQRTGPGWKGKMADVLVRASRRRARALSRKPRASVRQKRRP